MSNWIFNIKNKCWTFLQGGQFQGMGRYLNFSGPMYESLYNAWVNIGGVSTAQAEKLARYGTYLAAQESGYGSHRYSVDYNYGNMIDGKGGFQKFKNMLDYANAFVANMGKYFPNARNSYSYDSYMNNILNGKYRYAEAPDYTERVRGVIKRVDKNIDLWRNNKRKK